MSTPELASLKHEMLKWLIGLMIAQAGPFWPSPSWRNSSPSGLFGRQGAADR